MSDLLLVNWMQLIDAAPFVSQCYHTGSLLGSCFLRQKNAQCSHQTRGCLLPVLSLGVWPSMISAGAHLCIYMV